MPVWIAHVVHDVSDHPLLIQDVADPPRDQQKSSWDPPALSQRTVSVAEKAEGQPIPRREGLVASGAVIAYAEDDSLGVLKVFGRVPELARLSGSARGVVLGVEVHHDDLAPKGTQPDPFSVLIVKLKVWRSIAQSDSHAGLLILVFWGNDTIEGGSRR